MANTVTLKWQASTDSVDGYLVFRGSKSGQETQLTPSFVDALTYTDSAARAGANFYVVKSSVRGISSVSSNEVSVSFPESWFEKLIAFLEKLLPWNW